LIEPEGQVFFVNHAADEAIALPHGPIHVQSESLDPETQTYLEILAGNDRNA
jgi:hypothetical protein